MGGQNNKPIAVSNAFGALLDDDKKKEKKKKEEEKEAPLKSLSPMVNSSMNWADCADSDEDEFGGTPKWGDTMEPVAADTPPEAAEQEEEPEDDASEDEEEEEEDEAPEKEITLNSSKPVAPAPEEKQLSKKELKKLEMEELERALEELGMQEQPAAEPASADP